MHLALGSKLTLFSYLSLKYIEHSEGTIPDSSNA